jgi:hypothetical protein
MAGSLTLLLAGCGKSADQQHEDIVRCGGFQSAFATMTAAQPLTNAPAVDAAGKFVNGVIVGLQGVENEKFPGKSVVVFEAIPAEALKQYAAAMDPAKASRLEDEGEKLVATFAQSNDSDGAIAYYGRCLSTFRDLGN